MLAAILIIVAFLAAGPITADILTRPARHDVGTVPADLPAELLTLNTSTGETVAGWLARGKQGAGAVLLLHGVRADRRGMVARAIFLNNLGYTVICLDLPAHGESSGTHITFGLHEARGVDAALDYLARERPPEHVGVIGVSVGGAALLLGSHKNVLSAVVLESVFPTFDEAVVNRMHQYLGPMTIPLAALMLNELPSRVGISSDQLRPIDAIGRLGAPVLVISGGKDKSTTPDETARLFAAAREPKDLWIVEGAAHVDLHDFDTSAYERRIESFFAKYLGNSVQTPVPVEHATGATR
ncbi:MAG: alpha/beta hydrolase [Burkholderiales bacterium]